MSTTIQRLGTLGLVACLSLTGCAGLVKKDPVRLDPAATTMPEFTASKTAVVKPGLSIERW